MNMCRTRNLWFVLALLLVGGVSGCATSKAGGNGALATALSPRWEASGIRVVKISPAVGRQMLDLRYRITDVEQAGRVLKQTTPISLVDQVSGTTLPVPDLAKVGKLRSIPNKEDAGRLFWVFFNNSAGVVKPGNKVTLMIGNVAIRDIVVE
ncbi:hypothetical protein [Oryzomonas japonica]|nr:hypothetical protein [Oryzomonas japonica]